MDSRWTGMAKVCVMLAATLAVSAGCGKKDDPGKVVATVNGEQIRISDLRDSMGLRSPGLTGAGISIARKKDVLDRLVLSILMAQDARSRGLDNTEEFRNAVRDGGQTVLTMALLRKEVAAKVRIEGKDVDEEAKKMRSADNNLSPDDAILRASQGIQEQRVRGFQEEFLGTARKEVGMSVDNDVLGKIVGNAALPDNAVWARIGNAAVTVADAKKAMAGLPSQGHGGPGPGAAPGIVRAALERDLAGRVLAAYATKTGITETPLYKSTLEEFRRFVLVNMLAEKVVLKGVGVTDAEILQAYKEHEAMLRQKDGKLIPLAVVRNQLRDFLLRGKQRKLIDDFANTLKGASRITVDEAALKEA